MLPGMRGTIINVGAVAAGTVVGVLAGGRMSERVRGAITDGLGLFVAVVGVAGGMRMFERQRLSDAIVVLVALLAGGVVGTIADIEGRLERLGGRIKQATRSGSPRFAQGFLAASVLFCVGPLTILGSLRDGLSGDYGLLAVKSVLDGFAAVALAAVYGAGVAASIVTIVVVQGGLSVGAGVLRGAFTPDVVRALDATGGILILGIGLKLLDIKDARIGDFLPALALAGAGAWVLERLR